MYNLSFNFSFLNKKTKKHTDKTKHIMVPLD